MLYTPPTLGQIKRCWLNLLLIVVAVFRTKPGGNE
jgi:hypothetical protein